jgi:hypothetical protein
MTKALKTVKSAISTVWSAIKPVVSIFGRLLKTIIPPLAKIIGVTLGTAFKTVSSVINGVASRLRSFRNTLSNVRERVSSFISKVTAPFKFLGNLKLPHLSVSAGKAPWGIGGLGEKPSFSVQWYAKGGIVDGATLIGAGEDGKEAILPLERHTEWIGDLADKIGEQMRGDITFNIYGADTKSAKEIANEVKHMLIAEAKGRRTAWA